MTDTWVINASPLILFARIDRLDKNLVQWDQPMWQATSLYQAVQNEGILVA